MQLPKDRALLDQVHVLEHLGDELWLLNAERRFAYVNRAAREHLLGTSVFDFVPAPAREKFSRALDAAWSSGAAHSCETEWPDGTCFESRFVAITDLLGVRQMLVTTRDVTAVKCDEAVRR